MSWFKKIFGKKTKDAPLSPSEDSGGSDQSSYEPDPAMQRMMERGCEAREQALSALGELDPDVMAPLMNPAFTGGPAWPSFRQSWRIIRKPESTIVVSDGLSDPFEDEKIPLGYKLEVCAEAPEKWDDIRDSWLFDLVYQVSQLIAHYGNVYEMLEKYNTLSTVISVSGVPQEWESEDGKVGILLGFPNPGMPSHIQLEEGAIRLLTIKLLHPKELAFIEADEDMESQRNSLVEKFMGNHFSDVRRNSVV